MLLREMEIAHEFLRHPYHPFALRVIPDLRLGVRAKLREAPDHVLTAAGVPKRRRVSWGRVLSKES